MQQWIDLARFTGLQTRKSQPLAALDTTDTPTQPAVQCNTSQDTNIEEITKE